MIVEREELSVPLLKLARNQIGSMYWLETN